MRILLGAVTILASVIVATGAVADSVGPSYSCSKAQTDTEKAICGSPYLSALDLAMAHAYQALLEAKPDQDAAIRSAQRALNSKRDACHADVGCIAILLEKRIDTMLAMTGTAGDPGKTGRYNAVPADPNASLQLTWASAGSSKIDATVVSSNSSNLCSMSGPVIASPSAGGLVFTDQNNQPIEGGPVVTPLGDLLVLRGGSSFCGLGVSWPFVWTP